MNGNPASDSKTPSRSVIQKQYVMIIIKPVEPFKRIEQSIDLGKTHEAFLTSSAIGALVYFTAWERMH